MPTTDPTASRPMLAVKSGLSAYFNQPSGPSRPGVDWAIEIAGKPSVVVLVRTYFSSDPRNDAEQGALMEKAISFVRQKIEQGWIPESDTSFLAE